MIAKRYQLAMAALFTVAGTGSALAQTSYTVTTDSDVVAIDGFVSLREAMQAIATGVDAGDAPAGTAPFTIGFESYVTEIRLANGALPILQSETTIVGPFKDSPVLIAPPDFRFGEHRVFQFLMTGGGNITLQNLEIAGGGVPSNEEASFIGGCVSFTGLDGASLSMQDVTVREGSIDYRSRFVGGMVRGAGIYASALGGGKGTGEINLTRVIVRNCVASSGATANNPLINGVGAYLRSSAAVNVVDSSFNNNLVQDTNPVGSVAGIGLSVESGETGGISIRNSQVKSNYAVLSGSTPVSAFAISGVAPALSIVEDSTFESNYLRGGDFAAVVSANGALDITRSTWAFNNVEASSGSDEATCLRYTGAGSIQVTNSTFHSSGTNAIRHTSLSGATESITLLHNTFNAIATGLRSEKSDLQTLIVQRNIFNGSGLPLAGIGSVATSTTIEENFVRTADGTEMTELEEGYPNDAKNYVGSAANQLNPVLLPLGQYGGKTRVLMPSPCSPVVDLSGAAARAGDQRDAGTVTLDGNADGATTDDIGAVEVSKGWTTASEAYVFSSTDGLSRGDGSGRDWANAIGSLDTALSLVAATRSTCGSDDYFSIFLADGVYIPANESFKLPSNVALDGGELDGGGGGGGGEPPAKRGRIGTILRGAPFDQSGGEAKGRLGGESTHVVVIENADSVKIGDVTIEDGNADGGGRGFQRSGPSKGQGTIDMSVTGGGLLVNSPMANDIQLENVLFQNNYARSQGGAIYTNAVQLDMVRCEFRNNSSDGDGGAIYVKEGSVISADKCSFRNNGALFQGGAVAASTSDPVTGITFTESGFYENNAQQGGAIHIDSAKATLLKTHFEANSATLSGGAIETSGSLELFRSSFFDNLALKGSGGAINQTGDNTTSAKIASTTFSRNASTSGGHQLTVGPDVAEALLYHVTAVGDRGAQIATSTTLTVVNSIVVNETGDGLEILSDPALSYFSKNITSSDLSGTLADVIESTSSSTGTYTLGFDIQPNSVALEAGAVEAVDFYSFDQRGDDRLYRNAPDIGALEMGDKDGDGVWDNDERTVPSAASSSIQPLGDANGDEIGDHNQQYIASVRLAKGTAADKGALAALGFVTIDVGTSYTLTNVSTTTDPSSGMLTTEQLSRLPVGFLNFQVNGVPAETLILVDLFYSESLPAGVQSYYKYGPLNLNADDTLWGFPYGGPTKTGAEFVDAATTRRHFRLRFVDGADGDLNPGAADGVIIDPGGPSEVEPLAVDLGEVTVLSAGAGTPVTITWETLAEYDNAGFHLYRAILGAGGTYTTGERLTTVLIPAGALDGDGATYSFIDALPLSSDDEPRAYVLEDVDLAGGSKRHGAFVLEIEKSAVESWHLLD